MNLSNLKKPKVTVGLPVYNGGQFIGDRLESLLLQTFTDFELIISDNASTDSTSEICREFEKKDKRVRYFHHDENRGLFWNFNFLLKEAKTEYFVWAAVDDVWSQNFLEKNIYVLENNKKVVGSIGEYKLYNMVKDPSTYKTKIKVLENSKKFQYVHPIYGNVGSKIRFCLNYNMGGPIYGVYRTDKLQKSNTFEHYKNNRMWRTDLAYILNVIREGDFEVVNNAFMYKHVSEKSTSVIQYMKKLNFSELEIAFIQVPFTIWCFRNLGSREFLKNFGYFVKLNLRGEYAIIAELLRMCKRIVYKQEKYW